MREKTTLALFWVVMILVVTRRWIRREEENGEHLLIHLKSYFWSKRNGKTECGIIVTIVSLNSVL